MNEKWFSLRNATLFGALILLSCATDEKEYLLRTSIIIGDVNLVRKGTLSPLVKDQYLRPSDTVRVGENGKLKLELSDGAFWYLGKQSELVIEKPVMVSSAKRRVAAILKNGQLHIVKRSDAGEEFNITTSAWTVRVTAADITLTGSDNLSMCSAALLNGFASFSQKGSNSTAIPACSKLTTGNDGSGALQPITATDISQLKSWVGSTIVDEALKKSACSLSDTSVIEKGDTSSVNRPPEWKKTPLETASPGVPFTDTVEALDPEMGLIKYTLLNGPAGMTVDSNNGVVAFNKTKTGTYPLSIIASDPQGLSCTTSVSLQISGGLIMRLNAPVRIEPGKPFCISALIDKKTLKSNVSYRFDIDGDGVFDYPENGKFGKSSSVNNLVLSKEGTFKIRGEVRIETSRQIIKSARQLTVNALPVVVFKITPSIVKAGTPVIFDISGSSDTRNGSIPLSVKFDVDGDGDYDIPQMGTLTSAISEYAYSVPGTYHVTAFVTDKDGSSAQATADIVVSKGLSGLSLSGPDSGTVNDSLVFICSVKNNEFSLTEYSWKCSHGITLDNASGREQIKKSFTDAGVYTITCVVSDEKGQRAEISKSVVIQNLSSLVDAEGPYKAIVNAKVTFKGHAADADNKIKLFSWDTDGDGKEDVSSKDSPNISYTYTKSGVYHAILTVLTDDGKRTSDTANVEIINHSPKVSAGKDIVSRPNKKVVLSGTGSDTDGVIIKYEWDFEGDGVFDWKSEINGSVEHQFINYSKAVLRVTDGDGAIACDTVAIIICPDGMETIGQSKFCIDSYEYPNRKGVTPQTDITFKEAMNSCAKQGKRLCNSDEWEMACSNGKKGIFYPYGKQYEVEKCNTLGNPKRKNSIAVSGEFIDCKSEKGTFDMSGNVAEWTNNSGIATVHGGSWQNGEQESTCFSKVKLSQDKKYFYAGFRCCK